MELFFLLEASPFSNTVQAKSDLNGKPHIGKRSVSNKQISCKGMLFAYFHGKFNQGKDELGPNNQGPLHGDLQDILLRPFWPLFIDSSQ